MHKTVPDPYDRRILTLLQADGRMTNTALSEQVHLSASQILRRIRRLEEAGTIAGYHARLAPAALGLGVVAFTSVTLERHGERSAQTFHEAIQSMPEILECHAVSGEADYLLRIVVPDLKAFSDFLMHRLMPIPGVSSVKSNIALEAIKESVALPLAHLG